MKRRVTTHAMLAGAVVLSALSMASAQQQGEGPVARGARAFKSQGCYGCHLIGKFGTPIGPDLSHVGAKYRASYLTSWLRDPASVRPTAHMPKLELSAEDIQGLAAYLSSLK